jgi:hypothetical protein
LLGNIYTRDNFSIYLEYFLIEFKAEMRTIYLRKEIGDTTNKTLVDMAYLVTHKKIRLPKSYFRDGLYLNILPKGNDKGQIEKYFLTKDKIKSEDGYHYFFDFPFKPEQVESVDD